MKKILSLITLLLALSMLLTACFGSSANQEGTGTGEEETVDPATIAPVESIWHSAQGATVIDLRNLTEKGAFEATVYSLQMGYYQYLESFTGECTYKDYIITMTKEDGTILSWIYNATKGTLSGNSEGNKASYVANTELPTVYENVPFPKYLDMNVLDFVKLPELTELSVDSEVNLLAAVDIYLSYRETVTDKDVEFPIITGRKAQVGDYVNIDYKGYINDELFEGGSAEGSEVYVSHNSEYTGFIDGFTAGIDGQEVGTTFDVEVTFPEDYGNELAGKIAIFKITLNKIYDTTVTDEQVKELTKGEYETYQALFDSYVSDYSSDMVWNQALAKATCENMPEAAYGFFYRYYQEMYHYYATYYGVTYEYMLQMNGYKEEDLLADAKNIAKNYVVGHAIYQKYELTYDQEAYAESLKSAIEDMIENNSMSEAEAEKYVKENQTDMLISDQVLATAQKYLVDELLK